MGKNNRPPRPYGQLMRSLRLAWKIAPLDDSPFWETGTPELDSLPQEFHVAVWNICKGAGGVLFEHDYRILAYDTHLMLMQEALLSTRSLRAFREPGFGLLHGGSYMRTDGLRDGVLTASRAQFGAPSQRIVCKWPEPVFKTPKVALVTRHRCYTPETILTVINLHATLVRGAKRALEEIHHLLGQVDIGDGPVLLCGDFNTFTKKHFETVTAALAEYGLGHVAIPGDPRPQAGLLDHAFVRGLEVIRAEVATTIRSSDHFPLLLRLRLP